MSKHDVHQNRERNRQEYEMRRYSILGRRYGTAKQCEIWVRSRLPLDDDQQAKVEAQIRKIAEREATEQRERRNQRTDAN